MLLAELNCIKSGATKKSTQTRIWSFIGLALAASFAAAADLPPLPQGLTAPAKAITLPAFNMPTATGATVQSDDYKGKVIIARFWATW
jgi:hypothetical protein